MKNVIMILLLLVTSQFCAHGQCVIYGDRNNGAIGVGFNNDNAPTTFKECADYALKNCKERGGITCTEIVRDRKKGWWSLIIGQKSDGRNYYELGNGYASKDEAEKTVRNKYKMNGGVNADNIEVQSWYSYSNVKE